MVLDVVCHLVVLERTEGDHERATLVEGKSLLLTAQALDLLAQVDHGLLQRPNHVRVGSVVEVEKLTRDERLSKELGR